MRYRLSLAMLTVLTLHVGCQADDVSPASENPPNQPVPGAENSSPPGTMGTGWVQVRDAQPVQVTFAVHDGRAIFEGDIDLGPVDEIPTTREEALERVNVDGVQGMGVIAGTSKRWGLGAVPYVIDPALPMQYRVTDAIAHIEANNPGVDFFPRAGHPDYIYITRSTVCSSPVGRSGGMQVINLADGCNTGSAIHELLHALGMWHEQSRCDRDSYVEILLQNVQSGHEHNFNRYCSGSGATDVYAYDEGSIMHYGPYAFSKNGLPTIRSRRGLDHLMGQGSGMSTTDVSTVHHMYPPPQCGDWLCQGNEPTTCSGDCAVCGNGICELPEIIGAACYLDCGGGPWP